MAGITETKAGTEKARRPAKASNKVVRVAVDAAGNIGVRLRRLPGVWLWQPTPIDSILAHVERELGIGRLDLYKLAGINMTSVSLVRKGEREVYREWLVRLSDLSGIPYDELVWVGNLRPTVRPHPHSRADKRKGYDYLP